MMGIIIKYTNFYGTEIPENPLDLIKSIPKDELIATISAINARLKPVYSVSFDDSRETQIDCIKTIFLDNNNDNNKLKYSHYIHRFLETPKNHTLFTRVTCLYAFQEILSGDGFAKETPEYTFELRERIFKFLLIMNEYILNSSNEYNENDRKELGEKFFEYFMFKELPHNQYYASSNSINLFYKAWSLFKSISNHETYSKHLKFYLKETFDIDEISDFFKNQMYSYFKSYDEILKFNYINIKKDNYNVLKILDKFSERKKHILPSKEDLTIFEFLSLKKSPLYKNEIDDGKEIITYLVLDNTLFIEKTYSLFINDFWFDYLKPNNICNRSDWGSFIGNIFFEPFLENIFKNCFLNNKRTILKSSDNLKFKLNGSKEVEYADFYIRDKNKIILAEAKSNYLPLINGYKTVNTISDYKSLDLDGFYKSYGLTQLASKTIKHFHDYKKYLNDNSLNLNRKVKIFPLLIVNDPIFSSGYTSFAFRNKFIELLKKEKIDIDNDNHIIFPLSIINVSELQDIEQSLHDGDENFFNLLRYFFSIINVSRIPTEGSFIVLKTIEQVINKRIKSKLIADRIQKLKWLEN